jgi:hypothetical protein
VGIAALTGWAVLALTGGGIDLGNLGGGWGPAGFAVACVAVPALTLVLLWRDRGRAWGAWTHVAVGGLTALAAWSALSIIWASAPDLAWLSTDRTALALGAMVAGAAIAHRVDQAPLRLAIGVALGATPVLGWAIAVRVIPDLASPLGDTARLAAPLGNANALAAFASLALPGALILVAGRGRGRDLTLPLVVAALVVVVLTGSRSGALAAGATLACAVWLLPHRPQVLAASGAAVIGAIPAAVYALAADGLTATPFPPPAARRDEGLVLGALFLVACAVAVVVRPYLLGPARAADRALALRGGRIVVGAGLVVIAAVIAVTVLRSDATAQDGAGRFVSGDTNNRSAWWGEALRGFADAPLIGHGAGSFPLTHLVERDVEAPSHLVRQPHQLALELLTELGIIGLACALVALAGVILAARRARRSVGPAVCLTVPLLLPAQLDLTWAVPAVTLPALAAAGVIVGTATPARGARRAGSVRVAVAALVGVAVAVGGVLTWSAKDAAFEANLAAGRGDAATADTLARRAAERNPLAIAGLLVQARIARDAGDPMRALRAALAAADRQPENPAAWECVLAQLDLLRAQTPNGPLEMVARRQLAAFDPRRDPQRPPTCVATR